MLWDSPAACVEDHDRAGCHPAACGGDHGVAKKKREEGEAESNFYMLIITLQSSFTGTS